MLSVTESGDYDFRFRVSSFGSGGTIALTQDGIALASVDVPITGGWENWISVETTATLTAGTEAYRLEYSGTDGFLFDINWFELSEGGN